MTDTLISYSAIQGSALSDTNIVGRVLGDSEGRDRVERSCRSRRRTSVRCSARTATWSRPCATPSWSGTSSSDARSPTCSEADGGRSRGGEAVIDLREGRAVTGLTPGRRRRGHGIRWSGGPRRCPAPDDGGGIDVGESGRRCRATRRCVVVTTMVDGVDHAMTANSFTSVSLEPPLVLIVVDESRFPRRRSWPPARRRSACCPSGPQKAGHRRGEGPSAAGQLDQSVHPVGPRARAARPGARHVGVPDRGRLPHRRPRRRRRRGDALVQ